MENRENDGAAKVDMFDGRLLLPQYGRNVQKMIEFLRTIEDRTLRNRQAEVVVGLMGNLYSNRQDTDQFRNMVWDHLFMIGGLDLDVDSPFEKPTVEQFFPKPERVPYPTGVKGAKEYGSYPTAFAKQLGNLDITDQERDAAALTLAKYMRQKSYDYSGERPDNHSIIADINAMLDGAAHLEVSALEGVNLVQNNPKHKGGKSGNNKYNNGGNGNNNKHYNKK